MFEGLGNATGGLGAREFVRDDIKVGPTVPTAPGSLTGQPMGGSRVQQGTSNMGSAAGQMGHLGSTHVPGHTGGELSSAFQCSLLLIQL